MIVVDTTVWIDFLNGTNSPEKQALEALLRRGKAIGLTEIIVTEILRGIMKDSDMASVRNKLAAFPCLTARSLDTYVHAAELYRKCRTQGATIRSTIDCLIAAVCIEHRAVLLHHDNDFVHLAKHTPLQVINPALHLR